MRLPTGVIFSFKINVYLVKRYVCPKLYIKYQLYTRRLKLSRSGKSRVTIGIHMAIYEMIKLSIFILYNIWNTITTSLGCQELWKVCVSGFWCHQPTPINIKYMVLCGSVINRLLKLIPITFYLMNVNIYENQRNHQTALFQKTQGSIMYQLRYLPLE